MVYALRPLTWRDKWLLILRRKAFFTSRRELGKNLDSQTSAELVKRCKCFFLSFHT